MDIDQRVLDIIDKLEAHNYFVLITGGFVRDALLNKTSRDYDLVTNADLEVLDALFNIENKQYVTIKGHKLHTVSIIDYEGIFVEITRLRKETYDDHYELQNIEFVDTYEEDVLRRDFTINAIGYNKQLYDPLNGIKDLKNNVIKSIGDPQERFLEDPSRMIRALRLSATLNFSLDASINEAIEKHKTRLLNSKNINQDLKILLAHPKFDEIYDNHKNLFFVLSNGRFNNVPIENRTVLSNDKTLLAYLVYTLDLNYDNAIYNYLSFSLKDKRFILKSKPIVRDFQNEKTKVEVILYFIKEGQNTMLVLYDILKELNLTSKHNLNLIKDVYVNGYLRIDELAIGIHDIPLDFDIKQKYRILKEIQIEIIKNHLKNTRHDLLIYVEKHYQR